MKKSLIDKLIRYYLIIADFLLPIPLTILAYFLWINQTNHQGFSIAIITLALCYGYIVPEIATSYLRLWEFTWPFRIRHCFIHHGFIYSGYLSLIVWLVWPHNFSYTLQSLTLPSILSFLTMTAIGVHHDLFGFRVGLIINHTSQLKAGESAFKYISPIGTMCYGLLGLFYFLACAYAYQLFVIEKKTGLTIYGTYLILALIFLSTVIIPYSLSHRNYLRSVFRNRKDSKARNRIKRK